MSTSVRYMVTVQLEYGTYEVIVATKQEAVLKVHELRNSGMRVMGYEVSQY